MRQLLLAGLLAATALAGCSDASDPPAAPVPDAGAWTPRDGDGVWYHVAGARPLSDANGTFGNITLMPANGGYVPIGAGTFEPTLGITSAGSLFMTSYRGTGGGTHVFRSQDHGLNWTDVGPFIPGTDVPVVLNSNDPFLMVDAWTDRIFKLDMCLTLSGFCVEYSDDDGDTWALVSIATGFAPALDHQSFAAAPKGEDPTAALYPSNLVFCVNRGTTATGAWCSSSFDGGINWTPLVPGFPADSPQCSGLHGHVKGSPDGAFYRGSPSCDGVGVWRSDDGGLTWSEHLVAAMGTQDHDVEIGVDADGGVHAFWIGEDGLPYLASSGDRGETWGPARMVGAPGVTAAGFPTAGAGDKGRVAFAYIGTTGEDGRGDWNGYIGVVLDAYAEEPAITTVRVNAADDPLDQNEDCGRVRCGGFGDFISLQVDPIGRPYVALAHNGHDDAGIVGALVEGPSLRGNATALPPLALPSRMA